MTASTPPAADFSLCVAQLNPVVGDWQGNADRAIEAAHQAWERGHQLLVFPELFLCGYAAEDLYLRPHFLLDGAAALDRIVAASRDWPGLHLVIGHPEAVDTCPAPNADAADAPSPPPIWNAASVIRQGEVLARYRKQALPNYGVFDEKRYFAADHRACVTEIADLRMGLLICEDAWLPDAAQQARDAGADWLLVLNASPFALDKPAQRERIAQQRVQETGLPAVYAHMVGGQDELVFDGHSFALNADGTLAGRAAGFAQTLWPLQMQRTSTGKLQWQGDITPLAEPLAQLWQALVLSTRDYVQKNGFRNVLLGLSGGLDSALVLAIAVDALGAEQVRTVMMPSPYTASISLLDAQEMVERVQVQHDEIAIAPAFETLQESLRPLFGDRPADATEENMQARVRGILLMALSNKLGSLVLTTGNKSELAMGYCTLYGDMCGGFAPLKDVFKTRAFELARWRNAHAFAGGVENPIPERIITRPPSAELRPDQTDQDSLPPYEILDELLRLRMEQEATAEELVAAGFAPEQVQQVLRLLRLNEYKRRQGAPGPRLSVRSFGKDWRYPITNGYRG